MSGRMSEFRDAIVSRGGTIKSVGYVTSGDRKTAHVEVYDISMNMGYTIEQELHYVDFRGVRKRHMEFTVEVGSPR